MLLWNPQLYSDTVSCFLVLGVLSGCLSYSPPCCLYYSITSLGGGDYSPSEAVTKLLDPPSHFCVHQEVEFKFLNKPSNGHNPLKESHCLLGSPQRVSTIRLVLGLIVPGHRMGPGPRESVQRPLIRLSLSPLTTFAKLVTQQTS